MSPVADNVLPFYKKEQIWSFYKYNYNYHSSVVQLMCTRWLVLIPDVRKTHSSFLRESVFSSVMSNMYSSEFLTVKNSKGAKLLSHEHAPFSVHDQKKRFVNWPEMPATHFL